MNRGLQRFWFTKGMSKAAQMRQNSTQQVKRALKKYTPEIDVYFSCYFVRGLFA